MRRSSIACWPARGTASAGAGTGWTSGGTATGPAGASRSATASRTSGTGATGSSSRSTSDKPYDRMVVEMLAADEACPDDLGRPPRHRLPRAELQAAQPREVDAGRGRPHRPGLPGRDDRLRPMPRPHVRPDPPEGVLPGPRDLRAAPGPDRPRSAACSTRPRTASPAPIDAAARRQDAPVRPRRRPQSDRQSALARRPRIAGRPFDGPGR